MSHSNEPCSICTPAKKPLYQATELINDFTRTESIFSESHEGASLAYCNACGSKGIYYWVEIYDDIWRHWVVASEQEIELLVEANKNHPRASEDNFRAFFKGRMHAEQSPSGIRCWTERELLEGAPY